MPEQHEQSKLNVVERVFEFLLWNSRLGVLLAVVFGILSSLVLFVIGSMEIWHTVLGNIGTHSDYSQILIGIISGIDLYLIGIVLMIFSFGIYELFISKIEIARLHKDLSILDIGSLDELKNKLLKVIIMVLIVSFFRSILSSNFQTPLELFYFALSILAISIGAHFIRKIDHE